MSSDLDVLIVGAGPAGSTLAGLLSGAGCRVLIVDRSHFPREKACGECVNPGGVALLSKLGVLDAVRQTDPVVLEGWDLQTPSGRFASARFSESVGTALGVRRGPFDHALLKAARSRGAQMQEGVHVQGLDSDNGRPHVWGRRTGGGPAQSDRWERSARIVVGADGLRSVVAGSIHAPRRPARRVRASLSWHLEGPTPDRRVGHLLLGGPFTSGLAPVGPGLWTQTLVVDPVRYADRLQHQPDALRVEALQRLRPSDAEAFRPIGSPRASGPFDRPVRWTSRGPVVLVGDAAGYYDPLTGQGIFRALRSAELAADTILQTLSTPKLSIDSLRAYDEAVEAEFRPGRRLQRMVDLTLDPPHLRRLAIALLARYPRAADALVGVLGDRLPVRTLLAPGSWPERSAP